jgi:hypothetical protein
MSEPTPFPDGVGYMEYAWSGLSPAQVRVMSDRFARSGARQTTLAALRGSGLVTSAGLHLTDRGRALVEWAVRTGRLESAS